MERVEVEDARREVEGCERERVWKGWKWKTQGRERREEMRDTRDQE